MLTKLKFLSAGESHGPKLTAILDGFPAGLIVDRAALDEQMARRQKGYGSGGRMKIERDRPLIVGGVQGGRTTGSPIAFELANRDYDNWRTREIEPMTVPRPGHADLTGALKYGHPDLRYSLERASARETAMRVAAGALCRQLLAELGVRLGGFVDVLGGVALSSVDDASDDDLLAGAAHALTNDLCCPDASRYEAMRNEVKAARKAGDTLGGVFTVFAIGLPPGLGSYVQWDRRIEARIAMAMMSIQAVKGVEVGPAFANAGKRGSAVQDELFADAAGTLVRETNRAGGVEGGITTGGPVVVRVAKKPISTTLQPRRSVDLVTGEPAETRYERSDFCALPRAVPIGEAMLALVLADAMLEKLGGDSMTEIRGRLADVRQSRVGAIALDGRPWRFNYLDETSRE